MSNLIIISIILIVITFDYHLVKSSKFNDNNNEIEQNFNLTGLLFKDFSWSQCGNTEVIKFSRLEIDPDPVVIPGLLSIGLDVLLKANLTAPLPFSLRMKKKVLGVWIDIPCEQGFGSCDYTDFCLFWPYPKPCPEVYSRYNVPCSCPFIASRYNLPESVVGNATLPFENIPKWLENGHYSIVARLLDPTGSEKFCIQILMQMKVAN